MSLRKVTVIVEDDSGAEASFSIGPIGDGQTVTYGKGIRERVRPDGGRIHEHDGSGWIVVSVRGTVVPR